MAEDHDRESKTEEPTEKKVSDAVERGNVPFSRDVVTFGTLAGALLAVKLLLAPAAAKLTETLQLLFANAGELRLEVREDAGFLLRIGAWHIFAATLPVLVFISAGGLLASLLQNLPQANSERIRPQYSRISPAGGWKRIFGLNGLIDFAKSLAKLAAVSVTSLFLVKSELSEIVNSLSVDPIALPELSLNLTARVIAALLLISLALAGVDLALSRHKWRSSLRMTRQEVKDEFKQQEGDPMVKQRIRAIGRQRVSRRMLKKMPTATLVIANPTHFAVALRYLREEGGAPLVVAKGVDHLALRIREIAGTHDIPIVENKPLARALYDQAEIDQMIPAEFYRAVAEIIHFLQLRRMHGSHPPVS